MTANITVIVPVYRVEAYLCRCLDSILRQTYREFDLILIDDGSPDTCGSICDTYARQDDRTHVIHQVNGGLSAARNRGIQWALACSPSRYLTFIDSDDWVHPRYLELLLRAVEEAEAKVSVGFHRYCREAPEALPTLTDSPQISLLTPEELLVNHPWNYNYAWAKLYRKDLFKTLRYPAGKNFEDVFTTYRALFAAGQVALVQEEIYYYFHNPEGIAHSPWTPGELTIFEGMKQQLSFYREQGCRRAYEKELELYGNHIAYQLRRIRENKPQLGQNRRYYRKLWMLWWDGLWMKWRD